MKPLVAMTLLLLAISSVSSLKTRQRRAVTPTTPALKCKTGDSYEEDCNTCTCTDTGIYFCTRRACFDGPKHPDTHRRRRAVTPPPPPAPKTCKTGDSYEEDCNTCTCTDTGIYFCTRRACFDGPKHPDTHRRRRAVTPPQPSAPKTCKTGDSYEEDCNTCTCTDGTYSCTRLACYHGPKHPDTQRKRREINASTGKYGPYPAKPTQSNILRFEVKQCTPNEIEIEDCNHCKCTQNGKGFLCTQNACPTQKT